MYPPRSAAAAGHRRGVQFLRRRRTHRLGGTDNGAVQTVGEVEDALPLVQVGHRSRVSAPKAGEHSGVGQAAAVLVRVARGAEAILLADVAAGGKRRSEVVSTYIESTSIEVIVPVALAEAPVGMPGAAALDLCRTLADPIRFALMVAIWRSEQCVCDLRTATGEGRQNLVSHHLGVLRRAGIVDTRREGRWIYYRPADSLDAATSAALTSLLGPRGHGQSVACE